MDPVWGVFQRLGGRPLRRGAPRLLPRRGAAGPVPHGAGFVVLGLRRCSARFEPFSRSRGRCGGALFGGWATVGKGIGSVRAMVLRPRLLPLVFLLLKPPANAHRFSACASFGASHVARQFLFRLLAVIPATTPTGWAFVVSAPAEAVERRTASGGRGLAPGRLRRRRVRV
jgi:hypothetical protein